MGKSFFILNPQNPGVWVSQSRKMSAALEGGLGLGGPFSDRGGALEDITTRVLSRITQVTGPHAIAATLATLAPQNLVVDTQSELATAMAGFVPQYEIGGWHSGLPAPFILGSPRRDEHTLLESAGVMASPEPVIMENGRFRTIAKDHLELVGVAVLRRLGISSFYTVLHDDTGPSTCITVPGEPLRVYSTRPPFVIDITSGARPMALEVLDDNALFSLLKMHSVLASAKSLMADIANDQIFVQDELTVRSIALGHALCGAILLWPMDQNGGTPAFFDLPSGSTVPVGLTSIRELAEAGCVHRMICPSCHADFAKDSLATIMAEILTNAAHRSEGAPYDASGNWSTDIIRTMISSTLGKYMEAIEVMHEHLHPAEKCRSNLVANMN